MVHQLNSETTNELLMSYHAPISEAKTCTFKKYMQIIKTPLKILISESIKQVITKNNN